LEWLAGVLNLLLVLTLLLVRHRHLLLVRCHFLDAQWVVAVMVVAKGRPCAKGCGWNPATFSAFCELEVCRLSFLFSFFLS
jgi:hypothetical protein